MANNKIDYINHFIESVGIKAEKEKSLARILLKSAEDCQDFYIGFFGRNKYVIDDMLDYREVRIKISGLTLDTFLWFCDYKVDKALFEKVFLQSFTDEDISIIKNAVETGKITLDEIYNNFKKNPNENILKNVL